MTRDELLPFFLRRPFAPFEISFASGRKPFVVKDVGEAGLWNDVIAVPAADDDEGVDRVPLAEVTSVRDVSAGDAAVVSDEPEHPGRGVYFVDEPD